MLFGVLFGRGIELEAEVLEKGVDVAEDRPTEAADEGFHDWAWYELPAHW